GDQSYSKNEAANTVDADSTALELGNCGDKPRERTRVTDPPIRHWIEERPVVLSCIAVEQIDEHVGNRRAAAMRAIDVVVVNAVFREARGKCVAIASRRRRAEALHERRKSLARHAAFFRIFRLIRHSAICTALSAAPFRKLSETTHIANPCSTVGSLRMRET